MQPHTINTAIMKNRANNAGDWKDTGHSFVMDSKRNYFIDLEIMLGAASPRESMGNCGSSRKPGSGPKSVRVTGASSDYPDLYAVYLRPRRLQRCGPGAV